jgi:hypothetical protein
MGGWHRGNWGWRGGMAGWHGGNWGWRGGNWRPGNWAWHGGNWGWRGHNWGWRNAWWWRNRGWGWGGWWPAYAGLGLGLEWNYPCWNNYYDPFCAYGNGYPSYAYGYGYPYGYGLAAATAAPLVTGRSVVTGRLGNFCTTSVKTCELRHASYLGGGCCCRVPGGRARGSVTP